MLTYPGVAEAPPQQSLRGGGHMGVEPVGPQPTRSDGLVYYDVKQTRSGKTAYTEPVGHKGSERIHLSYIPWSQRGLLPNAIAAPYWNSDWQAIGPLAPQGAGSSSQQQADEKDPDVQQTKKVGCPRSSSMLTVYRVTDIRPAGARDHAAITAGMGRTGAGQNWGEHQEGAAGAGSSIRRER